MDAFPVPRAVGAKCDLHVASHHTAVFPDRAACVGSERYGFKPPTAAVMSVASFSGSRATESVAVSTRRASETTTPLVSDGPSCLHNPTMTVSAAQCIFVDFNFSLNSSSTSLNAVRSPSPAVGKCGLDCKFTHLCLMSFAFCTALLNSATSGEHTEQNNFFAS